MKHYRTFDHTADLGIEVHGRTIEQLFANASFALYDIMCDMQHVEKREEREIHAEGSDWADLIVNFLREALYLFNGEGWLVQTCRIEAITPYAVKAVVAGEVFDPSRHSVNMEIKAVTYHQATVQETAGGWKGRVICDV
jgi:SHS2 domain-containing protein